MGAGVLPLVIPSAIHAAEPAPLEQVGAASSRTLFLEGTGGVGAPLGWLGASVVVVPIRQLALHGGVGLGTQGVQIAAGARGRIPVAALTAVSVGASWSSGAFAGIDAGAIVVPETGRRTPPIWYWDRAHFVNLEVSLEREIGRFLLRPFAGLGYVLNGGEGVATQFCKETRCAPGTRARVVPFFGLALSFGVL